LWNHEWGGVAGIVPELRRWIGADSLTRQKFLILSLDAKKIGRLQNRKAAGGLGRQLYGEFLKAAF